MKKLVLSFIAIFSAGWLSAQTYPYVDVNQIRFVDSLSLANCVDTSAYLGDTVVTRGIVLTDGRLSEVGSGSVQGGNRPFVSIVDTADGGSQGPFKSVVIMGAFDNGSNLIPASNIYTLSPGFEIEITCIVTEFAGLIQLQPLNNNSINIVGGSPAQPSPVVINAGDIQDQQRRNILPTGEQWEGAYVELRNMTVTSVSVFSGGSRTEFTVQDSLGNQVLVGDRFLPMVVDSVSTTNPSSPDSIGRFVAPSVGTIYNHIRGVIFQDENGCAGGGNFAGGYEINPVYAGDFDKASPPPTVENVERNPLVPNASQSVTVTADISDLDGVVTSATLYYTDDQNAPLNLFSSATMTNTSGNEYSATIPATPLDSIVRYYIEATDDSSLTTTIGTEYYTVRANGLTIMDLQLVPDFATNDASAFDGDTVTVTGIVTASFQSGDLGFLYIQDPNASEYAGIYVNGGPTSVFTFSRGDEVRITGVVEENFGFTRLNADSATATSNTGTITPVTLDPSDPTLFGSSNAGLEKYESMLLRYENPSPTGQVFVVDTTLSFAEYEVGSGQSASVSARVLAGRQVNGQAQGSADVSYINDTASYGSNLNVTPIQVTTSMSMDYLDGILYFAFGNYKLTPRNNADFANLVVSIEEVESSEVKTAIYPNPTADRLNVQLDENYTFNQVNIQVIDLNGRLVLDTKTATSLTSLNLNGMERGVYMLRISDENQIINTSKLILK